MDELRRGVSRCCRGEDVNEDEESGGGDEILKECVGVIKESRFGGAARLLLVGV